MNVTIFPKGSHKFFYTTLSNYKQNPYKWTSTSKHYGSRKVSIEEKIGLTPKPKRPLSVYLRFSAKMRPKLLQENPNASVIDIAKIVGEAWKKIDPKLKDELQDEYKKDWVNYVARCDEYHKTLSPTDKIELMRAKEDEKLAKERKARKKEWQEKLATEWKTIAEEKKQKYYAQYKKEMEEYKIKLQKWENEMAQRGFRNVVGRT